MTDLKNINYWAGGVAQVVEHLPNNYSIYAWKSANWLNKLTSFADYYITTH
jgi:hypothetical protein